MSGRAGAARLPPGALERIAAEVGTPTYVYDAASLSAGARRWIDAAGGPRGVWFAVKANANLGVLRHLAGEGIGFEVGTPGEYARVRRAGIPAGRILVGGVPKAAETVRRLADAGADLVVLQAPHEVEAAAGIARADEAPLRAGIRVRPGVRAGAHPSLETASVEAKFGLAPPEVPAAWRHLAEAPGVEPTTLAVHLGSGLAGTEPWLAALEVLAAVAGELVDGPAAVRELDLGGGLGVRYEGGPDPDPGELVVRIRAWLRQGWPAATSGLRLRFEPGRSLCARAGVLLTRVQYVRQRPDGPSLVCDAGYTDFARAVLYGAEHRITPVRREAGGPPDVNVLGPTCESGDVVGRGRRLHGVDAGDLLVIHDVGAYGFVMASNYNSRPRPAEVLVEGGEADRFRVVRARERIRDLWRGETHGIDARGRKSRGAEDD